MEWIAKFYYDLEDTNKIVVNGGVVNTSFYDFKESLSDRRLNYFILDPSELDWKKNHGIEVFCLGDKKYEVLKDIFSSVLTNHNFLPSMVKCREKSDYKLIEEILSETMPEKRLTNSFLERIFNIRFIF